MTIGLPVTPQTGKGGKVRINIGDGNQVTAQAMTLQTSYTVKGESKTNLVYLLGTGMTRLNTRPAKAPTVWVPGVTSEVQVTPTGSNDEVQTNAINYINSAGVAATASADSSVAVTRPAAGEGAWVAIHMKLSDGAISATKGTDTSGTAGKGGLLTTYGTGAGQKPLIAVTDVLLAMIALDNGAKVVTQSEISYTDQERADTVAYTPLPCVGGVMLNAALVKLHTGAVGRSVYMTGYYLDGVMTEIPTAKDWDLTPTTSTTSETYFGATSSSTEITGWNFTFNQATADTAVKNAMLLRQGFLCLEFLYANGGGFAFVGTGAGGFKCSPTAINTTSVSGSLSDDPVEL